MDILSLVLRPIVSLVQIASSGPSRSDAPASPFQALHLLSRILPREICFSILDYAELWTKTSVSRADSCSVREHTPREAYVSLPIPNRNKLRTIVFKTRSHDQGWSSDNSIYHGTYEASWTWFEAGICTPDGVERNVTPCLIQVNVHAEETAKDHEIVWDVGEKDLKIKEWLDELRSGDVVAVYPMARFPGWRNNVLSVAVEVYYTL